MADYRLELADKPGLADPDSSLVARALVGPEVLVDLVGLVADIHLDTVDNFAADNPAGSADIPEDSYLTRLGLGTGVGIVRYSRFSLK